MGCGPGGDGFGNRSRRRVIRSVRRVVWITGASRGLGRRLAEMLAPDFDLGLGHHASPLPEIAGSLPLPGDVADPQTARRSIDLIRERFGRLDLFVANAAVIADKSMLCMKEEEWDRILAVNLSGAFWGLRAAAPMLTESKGAVVFVASIMGRRGAAGAVNYAASKAGLMGLAVSAARELAPHVRVNVVCPGYLDTDMGREAPKAMRAATRDHMLGQLADVEDAARLIREVAGLETVTGQVFAADGRIVPW